MIRIQRNQLSEQMQNRLDILQSKVNQTASDSITWEEFRGSNDYDELKVEILNTFRSKCAYCEASGASHIDHYWPRAPHAHNRMKGSAAKTFVWTNMLLSCSTCNGFECKASHMGWNADDTPMLLDPTKPDDDPFCYFDICITESGSFTAGWIDPRKNLTLEAQQRAEYTIRRLKLNLRSDLVRNRARSAIDFLGWVFFLEQFGPDYEAPSGTTIRQRLIKMVSASEPYLAPIKQILFNNPNIHALLIQMIPEMDTILASWAIEPLGCSESR